MRKIGILVFFMGIVGFNYAQLAGQFFTGTLKPGTTPNAVKFVIVSSATFTGQFTNVQFTLQIPDSILPAPVVTIKSNPLSANIPTAGYITLVSTEGGFHNYLFSSTPAASPVYSFTTATEITALEVELNCCPGKTSQARFAQLVNGGVSGQLNFYIEVSGIDNTNSAAPFYGTGAVNTPGPAFGTYSYVPLANVALPLKLTGFNAIKKDKNALLTWMVQNQDANASHFEIERSLNGINFTHVTKVNLDPDNGLVYKFTDANISSVKSKGLVFYRIKSVDKDGKTVYSEVRNIRINSDGFEVSLYPNPSKTHTVATINLEEAFPIIINISDAAGRDIKKFEIQGVKGANVKRVDLSGLASGSYLLKVRSGDQVQTIPIVKVQ